MKNAIVFDPHDLKGMCKLMDKYGNHNTVFPGKNEAGGSIPISLSFPIRSLSPPYRVITGFVKTPIIGMAVLMRPLRGDRI